VLKPKGVSLFVSSSELRKGELAVEKSTPSKVKLFGLMLIVSKESTQYF